MKRWTNTCVFQGLFNSLKGECDDCHRPFVWLPYGMPHWEVNKSYGPKAFQSHALLISSLSHHFGESFIAKITALEMQSKSSHHKNLYTQNPQLDDQGVFIWSIDKVSVGWLLVWWVVFFGVFSHNRSFWVFENSQRTSGFLKEHEKKSAIQG